MNSSSKFLGLTLALLIGVGGLYGCQSPATSVKQPSNNVSSGNPTNYSSNTNGTTTQVASTTASSQVKEALIMESEDEKYFEDSDTSLSSSDKSFSTKALGDRLATRLEANAENRVVALNGGAKATANANLKAKLKSFVSKNGAVKRNEDGSLTIDTNKLKENLKKAKELAKEQVQKLKRKNNVVRTGDVEEVKNEDGTSTKTGTVAFENKKTGLKRNVVAVRNLGTDGKLDSANYELTTEGKNFTRTVKRTVTVNEDGSKTIVFYSLTTFKDGRKREVNRTVNLDKDGNGTATGTIKLTKKDGTEKVITINATISKTNGTITIAKDPTTNLEVKSEEKTDGTTTVTTTEEGKTSTETVTEEKAEQTEASADASTSVEVSSSPAPAESPVASASPEASPSAEATSSPAPETSSSPAVEASAEASAS